MARNLLISIALIALVIVFFLMLPEPQDTPASSSATNVWPSQTGNSFVIRNVRLFDGEDVIERADVLVIDGLIAAVGDTEGNADLPDGVSVPTGTVEYFGDGHTLLPAFIDSHTHNFLSSRTEALRFGVGTQIDMFSAVEMLPIAKQQRESMAPTAEADMWSAGTLVTVQGGHGTQFGLQIPVVENAESAAQFIADRVAEGSDFIKLVVEDGYIEGQQIATLNTGMLRAAVTAAHAHERKAVVHISSQQDAHTAVTEGADGLVHLFGDVVADDSFLMLAKERALFIVPTLTVLESISARAHGLAADERLRPWLASSQLSALNQQFPASNATRAVIDNALTSTRLLYEAGVPILAGTDAGNPGTAHGASIHRELELLVQAGLPVTAALAAATSVPARHFGLTDRGNVVAGMRADLVLVIGNPLDDITHTRNIKAIWKNGYVVDRQTFDTADPAIPSSTQPAAPALTQPELGNFATGNDAWTPSSDRFQGGQSTSALSVSDGVLVVDTTLAPGTFWPWAGATRMLGQPPMSPVDVSAFSHLDVRLKGTGTVYLTVFSGSMQGIPAQWPLQLDGQWQDLSVELRNIPGIDVERLAAIAIVAGQVPGTSRIEIDSVVLR